MPKLTSTFTPLYLKLKQELSRKIRTGEYVAQQQLPTTLELMRIHGVSDVEQPSKEFHIERIEPQLVVRDPTVAGIRGLKPEANRSSSEEKVLR